MRSSRYSIVLGSLLVGSVWSAVLHVPVVTPAPELPTERLDKRQGVDAIDFAELLLTAIPISLRQIAATNLPAVSSILWEEFLDGKKPDWFKALPLSIQSYLIAEFGPKTALPTAPPTSGGVSSGTVAATTTTTDIAFSARTSPDVSPSSSVKTTATLTSASTSSSTDSTASNSTTRASASPIPTSDSTSPPASTFGLSKTQKIGFGVGIPLGVLSAIAVVFGCCFLLRRRKRKVLINGNERPSTPGFIPRFAFHERTSNSNISEHRSPLNPAVDQHPLSYDSESMIWEDDDDFDTTPTHRGNTLPPTMVMHGSTPPIMAPTLYHTHSSNRARGKRTSYTNLHPVAEVAEPDETATAAAAITTTTTRRQIPLQPGARQSLKITMRPIPAAATLKRKPISPTTSPTAEHMPYSPDTDTFSHSFLRPLIPNSGSSSSSSSNNNNNNNNSGGLGLGLGSSRHTSASPSPSSSSSLNPNYTTNDNISSPTSPPLSPQTSSQTYYVVDDDPDDPERHQSAYVDVEDGLYGGHRSLAAYPEPRSPPPRRRNSRVEWPLRNVVVAGQEKSRSPMWDRVYEQQRRYCSK